MNAVQEFLQEYLNLSLAVQNKLFTSLLVLVGLWFLRFIARRISYRQFQENPQMLYSSRKILDYVIAVLGVFAFGRIWIDAVQSMATYLGLLSAGLAIALQDLIVSLAGWLFIIWRRPFVVGDRIQVGEDMGDVIDIRLFSFSMLEIGKRIDAEQSTGRVLHLPNSFIFKQTIANFNQGLPYLWNEIPVLITFESDWEKAKRILADIVNKHAPDLRAGVEAYNKTVNNRFIISYKNVAPAIYTEVADSGVLFTLRYLVEPRQRRGNEQAIWEDILRAFHGHWDIDFAYPTQREYIHFREKKEPEIYEAPTVVLKKRPSITNLEQPDDSS